MVSDRRARLGLPEGGVMMRRIALLGFAIVALILIVPMSGMATKYFWVDKNGSTPAGYDQYFTKILDAVIAVPWADVAVEPYDITIKSTGANDPYLEWVRIRNKKNIRIHSTGGAEETVIDGQTKGWNHPPPV